MITSDIRTLAEGARVKTDVCVVGAGPVGLTLAAELSKGGVSVVVLESGGLDRDPWADALNTFESVGARRVLDPTLTRNRILGGSSSTWSGRVAAFDAVDFSRRPWVDESGWPVTREELLPYFGRTCEYLGGGFPDNTREQLKRDVLGHDARAFNPALLEDYLWWYSKDTINSRDFMRFGPRALRNDIPHVSIYLNATVTHVDTEAGGRVVTGLRLSGPDGRLRFVDARDYVLCAGGIENARILLYSDEVVSGGVGNARDQVGRYLMDHPRGRVGDFGQADFDRIQRAFSSYRVRTADAVTVLTRGVALSPALQEAEQLLNCSAWFEGVVGEHDAFRGLARLARLRDPVESGRAVLAHIPKLAEGGVRLLRGRSPVRALTSLHLITMVEQTPDPESRVTLADSRDALGMRRPRLHWKLGDAEARTTRRLAEVFAGELERTGLPRPRLTAMMTDESAPFYLPDVAHPMGTTRMSADPAHGVVDVDSAVHGVVNLYCAGTSVFSSAGHANPTQTALALVIRLADKLVLARRPTSGGAVRTTISAPTIACAPEVRTSDSAGDTRPLVLVTGATGKIGSRLVPLLVEHGYRVRALTSKMPPTPSNGVEWVSRDLRRADLKFSEEVAGCSAVLHLGAELRHPGDMALVNGEATGALAEAAEAAGVSFMCYLSSISVYGTPIARNVQENEPTLTPFEDVSGEYWGNDALRTYGRTKLQGELALKKAAKSMRYVVFRPTVVVDESDLEKILEWNAVRRLTLSRRNAQHISVLDVCEAVVWALERSDTLGQGEPGLEVFNLGDWSLKDPTFRNLLAAHAAARGKRRWTTISLPAAVDWGREIVRHREIRRPIGVAQYSTMKLQDAGFQLPYGMQGMIHSEVIRRSGDNPPA